MENRTMVIDNYEFKMAQTYFDKGLKDIKVYFDIFFRKNPFDGGYTIFGGLDDIINYINNFRFEDDDIEYLRNKKCYSEGFLEYLSNLYFTGDISSVENGTVVFPNEPVITIRANVIEAQLIETALLACFNHSSLVTTSARRICEAALGRPVMEFGARRARGIDSSTEVSRCAYVGGCCGTSNEEVGKRYGVPTIGTMAHSLVTFFDDEYEAFLEFAKSNPDNCTFLVDTYDTLRSGIPNAIRVADEYLTPNGIEFKGIRIDSGDLAYLSKEARKMLDEAGYTNTGICLSNGLNEDTIRSLIEQGTPFNSLGVGDNISASKERLGGVYKLVAVEKENTIIPKIKVSEDSIKTINPGYKKLYRFYDKSTGYALGDLIALSDEVIPMDGYTLINPNERWKMSRLENYVVREMRVPIFIGGKQVYDMPNIHKQKEYCEKEFSTIYPEIKRRLNPHEYYVDLSEKLLELKDNLIMEHTFKGKGENKIKVRKHVK